MYLMRRYRLHHGVAALVCSLVVVFAVSAKVAAYHTSDTAAKPIASAKMWQTSKAAPIEDVKTAISGQPMILLMLLLSLPFADRILQQHREMILPKARYLGFPPLAVRPPPAR